MSKDTSGTAFPLNADGTQYEGLTKREYFAGLAMQGFASDSEAVWKDGVAGMARCAFEWADAMIAEGNK